MTLIVVLNAVLAVSILSAIIALHTSAIFADRRRNGQRYASAPRRSATRSLGSSTPQLSRTRSGGTAALEPSTDW